MFDARRNGNSTVGSLLFSGPNASAEVLLHSRKILDQLNIIKDLQKKQKKKKKN